MDSDDDKNDMIMTDIKSVEHDRFIHHGSCTDVPCCILFVMYLIVMISITAIAFINSKGWGILIPTDSNGTKCGHGEKINDPKLFLFDFSKCIATSWQDLESRIETNQLCNTTQMCISKCPEKSMIKPTVIDDLSTYPYCTYVTETDDKGVKTSKLDCAPYVLSSSSLFNVCIPLTFMNKNSSPELQNSSINLTVIKTGLEELTKLFGVYQTIQDITNTIDMLKYWFVVYFMIILLFSFAIIVMMRHLAKPVVVILIVASLGISGFAFYESVVCYRNPNFSLDTTLNKSAAYRFARKRLDFNEHNVALGASIIFGIIFLVVLILSIMILLYLNLTTFIMSFVCKIMSQTFSLFIFPIVMWIVEFLVLLWLIATLWFIITSENSFVKFYLHGEVICKFDETQKAGLCGLVPKSSRMFYLGMTLTFLFGWIWLFSFVLGAGAMSIAVQVSNAFWSKNKQTPLFLKSVFKVLFFHSGSVAFGSLLIALLYFIRAAFEIAKKKFKEFSDNKVMENLTCFISCGLKLVTFMVTAINQRAYIQVAVNDCGFCQGARKGMMAFLRNPIKYFTVVHCIQLVILLAKLFASFCAGCCIYYHMKYIGAVHHLMSFTLVFSLITFLYLSAILNFLDIAIEAVFFCLDEDAEKYEGSHTPVDLRGVFTR